MRAFFIAAVVGLCLTGSAQANALSPETASALLRADSRVEFAKTGGKGWKAHKHHRKWHKHHRRHHGWDRGRHLGWYKHHPRRHHRHRDWRY